MLSGIGERSRAWLRNVDPWTNVYGVSRTLLAIGTLTTLLFSRPTDLFRPALDLPEAPICSGISRFGLFCQLRPDQLEISWWIAIAILVVVASGWRPRWTGILHWWVAVSLATSAITVDGGDQVTAILTLLLLPVTFTDPRRWHWDKHSEELPRGRRELARLLALTALVAIRVQVAGIYFHSATAKFHVPEWANGTAVYYWFTDPLFGAPPWLATILDPMLANPISVTMITWGALVLEIFLFTGLVMDPRHRRKLLVLGLMFHAGIALVHGLVSFALAMCGALILYLRPPNDEFRFPFLLRDWVADRAKFAIRVSRRLEVSYQEQEP